MSASERVWRLCVAGSRAGELSEAATAEPRAAFDAAFDSLQKSKQKRASVALDACGSDEKSLVGLIRETREIDRAVGEALIGVVAFFFAKPGPGEGASTGAPVADDIIYDGPNDAEIWARAHESMRTIRGRFTGW